ncbi:MAG: class I SAM-dependent methyltransferase [Clostridium sp.]|nr:class I SAM-dependent methyltransferase [Clostridium sp.]MCM1172729.1 class I SAM-dependent methyltransferase [Clostridium sp.]MCM1207989.1 class I SAM-dependent methyltransferase [Ruminococcus sp.]
MSNVKLSKRMQTVVDFVDERSVADIGCDHAHVAIWLAMHGVGNVVAMDIKSGPLKIAEENIRAYGLEKVIEVRQSDGMAGLKLGEASCAIIAGMGGELITKILDKGKAHLDKGIHLILQPQSEIHKVREFLLRNNYSITKEKMLVEEDKFYNVMKALPAVGTDSVRKTPYSELEIMYGRILLEEKDRVLKCFLTEEKRKRSDIRERLKGAYTPASAHRLDTIGQEIALINQALEML